MLGITNFISKIMNIFSTIIKPAISIITSPTILSIIGTLISTFFGSGFGNATVSSSINQNTQITSTDA